VLTTEARSQKAKEKREEREGRQKPTYLVVVKNDLVLRLEGATAAPDPRAK
jgi:hypothetical protein